MTEKTLKPTQSACKAMTLTHNPSPVFLNINLRDVREVKTNHLPDVVLTTAPLKELERRAEEIAAEYEHLKEEAPAVVHNEKLRRKRLAAMIRAKAPLQLAHSGPVLADHFAAADRRDTNC